MLLFDVLVRYPAITFLLLSAFFCFRDGRHLLQARLGGLTGIAIAALLLGTAQGPLKLPDPGYTIVRLLDIPNLAFLWLFARSLFEDDFRMGRFEWTGLIFYSSIVGFLRMADLGWIPAPRSPVYMATSALSAAFAFHLIWTALAGRSNDLVESRRRGRPLFSLGLAFAAMTTIIAEAVFGGYSPEISLLRAAVTFPMALWALIWLFKFQTQKLLFTSPPKTAPVEPAIDPKDAVLHERLNRIMDTDEIYKEQGLTIGILAEKLGVPEHQLRALINRGLGFRNFSMFLNKYRIAYAKDILSDPAQARLPILTIAMDAGYNSLAPFNRAFKTIEGLTPTEFRKRALSQAAQS